MAVKNNAVEGGKDGTRIAVFGAIGTVVTYFLSLPEPVEAAIIVLALFGLTYVDSFIHNTQTGKLKNINGLLPF